MRSLWNLLRVLSLTSTGFILCPGALQGQQFLYTNDNISKTNSTTALKVKTGGALKVLKTYTTGGAGAGGQVYFGLSSITSAQTSSETCLFVSNGGNSTIAAFTVDLSTGGLKAVSGSPFSYGVSGAQEGGIGLAAGNGELLFAGNTTDNSIALLKISPNCALAAANKYKLSGSPDGMKVTPNGAYLVASYFGGQVDSFKIGYSAGTLTELGPFSSKGATAGVDISCNGSFAYFGDLAANTQVEVFSIGTKGKLKAVHNFTNSNGENSSSVLLSANGEKLYVSNTQSNEITTLSVGSKGGLTYDTTVKLNKPGMYALGLTMGENNPHLFVSEQGNPEAIGVLTPKGKTVKEVTGSPFHVIDNGDNPAGVAAVPALTCP